MVQELVELILVVECALSRVNEHPEFFSDFTRKTEVSHYSVMCVDLSLELVGCLVQLYYLVQEHCEG